MPDLSDPIFTAGTIAEDESGIQAAAFLRITAEAFLFMDPKHGTPRERWKALLQIHESVKWQTKEMGLQDVHAFLPPNLGKGFDRRLKKLGWGTDPWRVYSYRVR